MKIGIDIDGVILDSETAFKVSAELYSLDVLGEDKMLDNSTSRFEERYSWTKEQREVWHQKYLPIEAEKVNFMPGAIEVIKRLKNKNF